MAEPCSIEGCGRGGKITRGWCGMHYHRWQRTGNPLGVTRIFGDDLTRMWSKIDQSDHPEGCWVWLGAPDHYGYGKLSIDNTNHRAHIYVYEHLVGPHDQETLDHMCHTAAVERGDCSGGSTCRHRLCVNPEHLAPMSLAANKKLGLAGIRWREKTHCPQGHPYEGANLYIYPRGNRACVTCRDAARRRYAEKNMGTT